MILKVPDKEQLPLGMVRTIYLLALEQLTVGENLNEITAAVGKIDTNFLRKYATRIHRNIKKLDTFAGTPLLNKAAQFTANDGTYDFVATVADIRAQLVALRDDVLSKIPKDPKSGREVVSVRDVDGDEIFATVTKASVKSIEDKIAILNASIERA